MSGTYDPLFDSAPIPNVRPVCEPHAWVARLQPDLPHPIGSVSTCMLCGDINSADLAEQLRPMVKRTNALQQRVQQAEAQNRVTIEDCKRQGMSIGRGLANAGYRMVEEERDRARSVAVALEQECAAKDAAIADALRWLDMAATYATSEDCTAAIDDAAAALRAVTT